MGQHYANQRNDRNGDNPGISLKPRCGTGAGSGGATVGGGTGQSGARGGSTGNTIGSGNPGQGLFCTVHISIFILPC